jgi:hypothetical protein
MMVSIQIVIAATIMTEMVPATDQGLGPQMGWRRIAMTPTQVCIRVQPMAVVAAMRIAMASSTRTAAVHPMVRVAPPRTQGIPSPPSPLLNPIPAAK